MKAFTYPSIGSGSYDRIRILNSLVDAEIDHVVWNKLYRSSLWQHIRFPEGHVYEDVDTTYRIFDVCTKVMICNSMMASVGNSMATESRDKNYSDMRLFDFIYMTIAGWSTTCLLCLYQPFIYAWIGKDMLFGMPVVIGLCLYFYILIAGAIRWVYHEGAGLWWECRYIMIGEAAANVVLNILLCKVMGVAGIILATVISVFTTNCILCPRLIFKEYFKNGKLHEYWMDHVWYSITMMVTAGASWLICENALPMTMVMGREIGSSILCFGGRVLVCSVMALAVFWIIWHRSATYERAVGWTRKFLKV